MLVLCSRSGALSSCNLLFYTMKNGIYFSLLVLNEQFSIQNCVFVFFVAKMIRFFPPLYPDLDFEKIRSPSKIQKVLPQITLEDKEKKSKRSIVTFVFLIIHLRKTAVRSGTKIFLKQISLYKVYFLRCLPFWTVLSKLHLNCCLLQYFALLCGSRLPAKPLTRPALRLVVLRINRIIEWSDPLTFWFWFWFLLLQCLIFTFFPFINFLVKHPRKSLNHYQICLSLQVR